MAGLARMRDQLHDMAVGKIRGARDPIQVLMKEDAIVTAPATV